MTADMQALLEQAREAYADDPQIVQRLDDQAARLREPLRVAIVGMVKAGKSTLLNALLGEDVAPTDTGECTRIVTWFRHGETPRITIHLLSGEERSLAVRRSKGRLAFNLGATKAEEVSRIVVDWPAEILKGVTIIDTPGIGSVSTAVSQRARDFLLPEGSPASADAVVYITRHLHEVDREFLGAVQDAAAGLTRGINTIVVLGRADELGAGRIDSLLAARTIAARYAQDHEVRGLSLQVVPVAGLLAQGARTLRQADVAALTKIAGLSRAERERILVSADRFTAPGSGLDLTRAARTALLDRFGLFGVRLASVLIGNGVERAADLSAELSHRSGIDDVAELLSGRLRGRAEFLKADAALALVESIVLSHPRDGAEALQSSIERIRSGAHDLAELRLLAGLSESPLTSAQRAEARRLLGGVGTSAAERLTLEGEPSHDELLSSARDAAARWHAIAEGVNTEPEVARIARLVVRSAEGVLAELDTGSALPAPLSLAPEPGLAGGQYAHDERRAG